MRSNNPPASPPDYRGQAASLVENGYLVVPIKPGEKSPAIASWQRARLSADEFDRYPGHGVGVLTGQGQLPICGVDIDVSHPAVLAALLTWCETNLGQTCTRIGAAPRVLLPYRAAEPGWAKSTSISFFDPLDPVKPNGKRNEQRIEVLGAGQQFVAHHVHPDTGQPYEWTDLFGGIAYVPAAHLPVVTQDQMRSLLAEVAAVVRATPGVTIDAEASVRAPANGDPLAALSPRLGLTREQAAEYLAQFENRDLPYEDWVAVGMALHHEFAGSAEGLAMWRAWGSASSKDDPEQYAYKWSSFGKGGHRPVTFAFVMKRARAATSAGLDQFLAYLPDHRYIYLPTRELWPAASVNAHISDWPTSSNTGRPTKPSDWLDTNRAVQQMTWWPGLPELIEDRAAIEGGIEDRPGVRMFNLYRPPEPQPGDPHDAAPWLDHLRRIYPEDADHILRWFAHRVQRPGEKLNHALVLGGAQGIGKDTLLEPVKRAVGGWNWQDISPSQVLGRFNGWAKGVVVRISEARDLGDVNRYALYEATKTYIAAPPDVIRVDEKNLREHYIVNVLGVVITTNHRGDGLYLPADDRRHYVAWSDRTKEDFREAYWRALWDWLNRGGANNVAAYLRALDLTGFDPKAPPPKTPAFWVIVAAGEAPESGELRDAIERLPCKDAFTLTQLTAAATAADLGSGLASELTDRRLSRSVPHKLERVGYVPVRNPDAPADGLWRVDGRRCAIYARANLPLAAQLAAATHCSKFSIPDPLRR